MKIIYREILTNSFLFSNIDEETLSELLIKYPPTPILHKRGEMVYSSDSAKKLLGIIVSGKCEIRRSKSYGGRVVLNVLESGGSFGVLSIFSEESFPTQIYATKNSEILYFTAHQIKGFVNNYSQISLNIINFFANRVNFLNKKIETFSGTRVEDRLASFLLCERINEGSDSFSFNCQKASEEINAGRASVYRALSSLSKDGIISFDNKKITIVDLCGLERKTK